MLLRNRRVPALLIVLLGVTAGSWGARTLPVGDAPQASTARASSSGLETGPAISPPQTAPSPGQSSPAQSQDKADQAKSDQSKPDQSKPADAQPAQDQSQSAGADSGIFVFKKQVEEVVVHATVADDKNHLVTTLDQDAFRVLENGQPQKITSFRHEDVPVAMGIVIDNSGSMREKRDKVNKAALNLVRSSNPQDQVCIVNFNDESYLDQDFTSSINKMQEALEKVEARGGTALYDAVMATAAQMKKHSELQKKVIFVVTDGEDNASRHSLEEAVRWLQEENGPTVYAIGLLAEEKGRRARRALETIAERTGGLAFFPKTLDEVDEISRTVAHDIRNQYTIVYKPTTPKNAGGYRAIKVEARAKGKGKLTVRTRSGYYPGQEHAPQ